MQPVLKTNQAKESNLNFLEANQSLIGLVSLAKAQLSSRGWTVVHNADSEAAVLEFLRNFGDLLPQYTGELTYQVKALPGFENFQYSQSANTIQPHTEAPVYSPPPKYLALYCRRQATCGAGHTLLADGFAFIQNLPPHLRLAATTQKVNFSGYRTPDQDAAAAPSVLCPILTTGTDGHPILRFSYNIFRYNNLHPSLNMDPRSDFDSSGRFFREMSERAHSFFEAENVGILIPDNGLLIFDNHRMLHARSAYTDLARHLTRYWIGDAESIPA